MRPLAALSQKKKGAPAKQARAPSSQGHGTAVPVFRFAA